MTDEITIRVYGTAELRERLTLGAIEGIDEEVAKDLFDGDSVTLDTTPTVHIEVLGE